jgi:predicted rRNA methylase YqxC with S4 and FtsJ domains
LLGVAESPIKGKDKGNVEYLAWWRKPAVGRG